MNRIVFIAAFFIGFVTPRIAAAQYFPQAEQSCLSAYGQTACGYGCLAAYGDVQCATQPDATCEAAYGQIACGFDCEAAYGQIRCAQTPNGICVAAYGEVTCFESQAGTQPWSCGSAGGATACGYGCIVYGNQLACAQDPSHSCTVTQAGFVTCGESAIVEQPECLSAYGQTVCGYGCEAAYGQVAFSSSPRGVRQAAYGQFECFP